MTAEEAYKAYKAWCKDSGVSAVSANRFGRAMEALGYERGKDNQVRSYRSIQLRQKKGVEGQIGTIPSILLTSNQSDEKNKEKTVLSVQPVRVVFDDIQRDSFPSKLDVLAAIKMVNPMMPVEDLIAAFPGESRVHDWITELKSEGAIFESRNGFLKVLE